MMHSSILKGWAGRGALSLALLAGAVAVFLMTGGLGEGQACGVDECIEYPEHGSGTVIAFTAVDPEGEPVSWSISDEVSISPDAALFDISGGRLTFKTPPDYEAPGDSGQDRKYEVTVVASDNDTDSEDTTRSVEVDVTNVEEPGSIRLSTVQPKEGVPLTATLTDPDRGVTNGTWQWSRAVRATGPWTDIKRTATEIAADTVTVGGYTPGEDDVGMYLRATASYEDGHCVPCNPKKMAQVVSTNSVQVEDYANTDPMFEEGETTGRSIAENSPAGTEIGDPVAATDRAEFGPDVLTYSLGENGDNLPFDIDGRTGQIRVGTGTAIDYEDINNDDHQYTVTVTATDSSNQADEITVTINVIDVDENPTITAGEPKPTVVETIGDDTPALVVGTEDDNLYMATDPEDNPEATTSPQNLRWSLSGRDANKFVIDNSNFATFRGQLRFREAPDYEVPTDANRDNLYNVTVVVTDRGGNTDTRDVVVEVINADEDGGLSVSSRNPREGLRITAFLRDPDEPLSKIDWTWTLGAATVSKTDSYTPKNADIGSGLLVAVKYTDGTGMEREFNARSLGNVAAKQNRATSPSFAKQTDERSVKENVEDGTTVVGEVEASDPDSGESLTYSMSGDDAVFFSIDQTDGEITVRKDTRLDHEKRSSYRVTVKAVDLSGASDSVHLTIRVDNVDEPPVITSGYGTIHYAENGTGTVGTYVAWDPEGETLTWTLDGADKDQFTLVGGRLKFKAPPDFESPGDDGRDRTYAVTVQASDGDNHTGTPMNVDVILTNVDEEGTLSDLPQRPKEDVPITAVLNDPDTISDGGSTFAITNLAWQWARASSRSGPFTDIEDVDENDAPLGKSARYEPTEKDVGKYLRATVSYTDATGAGKSAQAVSTQAAERKDYSNKAPEFQDAKGEPTSTTERSVKENAALGTRVGAPVAATDLGRNGRQETLTYELGGANSGLFDINRATGQLTVGDGTTLNHEESSEYTVTVTATDSLGEEDEITVTINVEDVDETPDVSVDTTQGTTGTLEVGYRHTEPVGDSPTTMSITFTANDPETLGENNAAALEWTLTGRDADDFDIVDGVLTFKNGPDFEAPTDSNRNNVYEVTVQATDLGGNTVGNSVMVTVNNADEPGAVSLPHTHPEVGTRLTATLTDPDKLGRVAWQWYRGNPTPNAPACTADNDNDCPIASATSASYVPAAGDVAEILTVQATYMDGEGSGKTEQVSSAFAVQDKDDDNKAPQFEKDESRITTDERSVAEGEELNRNVGLPLAARDLDTEDDDANALFYSLGGSDAASFSINPTDGQITTNAALDFESKNVYRVTVKALDPSGASATVTVTIKITDVNEPPVLSTKGLVAVGSGFINYEENRGDVVAEYTATGSEGASVSWSLGGPDAGDFSINRNGQLTFRRSPNFEAPADANRDNTYEITVTARAGSDRDELDVTVNVTNLEEAGAVSVSPARIIVGGEVTATLSDIDGTPTGVSWDWATSEDGATGWTNIAGANTNLYTPVTADVGNYLRATAYYTDPEGPGKSVNARTSATVLADDDGSVTLSETRPAVGDTIRAALTDPDGSITNTTWQWAISSDGESGWSDIAGATSATYTVTTEDTGQFLRATANYDDGDGADKNAAAATTLGVGVDDDGSVSLSPSSPTIGETVTATLTDPDGGVTGEIWQWASSSDGTSDWNDIALATSRTYTVVAGDLGSYLRASVIYDDAAGAGKSAEEVTAAAVTEDDDGSVTLSPSSPQVGETITAVLSDPDGRVTGVTWTWAFSSNGTTTWRTIIGANSSTYTTVTADVGSYLRATASYTDAAGPGKSAEAVTTAAVTEDDDGSVTLSSTGTSDGDRVTATLTDPDGRVTGIRWQWASSPNGSSGWLDILNATSATYTPITTDVGRYLRATATYTDAVGPGKSAEAVTAAAVTPDDDGTVTLSTRTPEVGSAISATLSDPDGGVTGATWQWAKSSNGSTGWTNIQGATSASYTPGRSDAGAFLRATASYDDAVGTGKSAQAATSAGVAQMELLSEYDANRDRSIERSEAIQAVSDYFGGQISKDDVLAVLVLYFSG